jgi:hypothetical protein
MRVDRYGGAGSMWAQQVWLIDHSRFLSFVRRSTLLLLLLLLGFMSARTFMSA